MSPSGNPFRQSVRILGLFIRSKLIIATLDTLLYATRFAIAHVPWWPLFALIGGFCSLIPSIGSLIPLSLVGVTMLLADRDWTDLAIAFGAWFAIQAVEGFFLSPFCSADRWDFGPLPCLLAVSCLGRSALFWRCPYWRLRMSSGRTFVLEM